MYLSCIYYLLLIIIIINLGSYLGCLFCGGSGYYLSPISFLKDPTQWIRAMSNFRATHTQVILYLFIYLF